MDLTQKFIKLTKVETGCTLLVEPTSVVAIEEDSGQSTIIFLRNSNLWFRVAGTIDVVRKKVRLEG